MTAVFHTWLYGRSIEIQRNLKRKKLHRTNQGSNFHGGSFSNRDNIRAPIQFRRESQPQQNLVELGYVVNCGLAPNFRGKLFDSLKPECVSVAQNFTSCFYECFNRISNRKQLNVDLI